MNELQLHIWHKWTRQKVRGQAPYVDPAPEKVGTPDSNYRRRIENRTQAYEWYQFQWPWVTSKPGHVSIKVTILFNLK